MSGASPSSSPAPGKELGCQGSRLSDRAPPVFAWRHKEGFGYRGRALNDAELTVVCSREDSSGGTATRNQQALLPDTLPSQGGRRFAGAGLCPPVYPETATAKTRLALLQPAAIEEGDDTSMDSLRHAFLLLQRSRRVRSKLLPQSGERPLRSQPGAGVTTALACSPATAEERTCSWLNREAEPGFSAWPAEGLPYQRRILGYIRVQYDEAPCCAQSDRSTGTPGERSYSV